MANSGKNVGNHFMKKSELREVIRSIVKRKLSEQVTISHGENGKVIDAIAELEVSEAVAGAQLSASNPVAVEPVNAPSDEKSTLTQADQDKVDKLMAEKNKLQQELEQIRGQTAKLTEPFQKKTIRINKRIADINANVNRLSGK